MKKMTLLALLLVVVVNAVDPSSTFATTITLALYNPMEPTATGKLPILSIPSLVYGTIQTAPLEVPIGTICCNK
jgi:hypothetical protein